MLVPEAVLLEHLGRKMIQRDLYSFDGTVSDDIADPAAATHDARYMGDGAVVVVQKVMTSTYLRWSTSLICSSSRAIVSVRKENSVLSWPPISSESIFCAFSNWNHSLVQRENWP